MPNTGIDINDHFTIQSPEAVDRMHQEYSLLSSKRKGGIIG
jgi:hypothetical protein